VRIGRDLGLDRIVALLAAPRLGEGQEEALVARQAVDDRGRLPAERDLSAFGTFLIMGVVGLFVAMLINLFLQSPAMQLAISAIGVLLFAGLTAYDTQKIKSMYAYVAGTDMMGKVVIMGALNLYLDFVNMFMFLLRFMGDRR
jgi:FtsH-binding integral membrane protein